MTEGDWLACSDARSMWHVLEGKMSRRKLLLLFCAEFRPQSPLKGDDRVHRACEVAERFADGLASEGERMDAYELAARAAEDAVATEDFSQAAIAAGIRDCLGMHVKGNIRRHSAGNQYDPAGCQMIREVFGNPFRPVAVDPLWLTSDVVALVEGVYQNRAFDRMPILADALQDAGCDNADVLNHCRDTNQVHVRGCWVIDLILGKG